MKHGAPEQAVEASGIKPCPRYTFGVGDRFARSAPAQLQAFIEARALGLDITPVWNKSNREHLLVGSDPRDTREAADRAVADLGWQDGYLVDADHINLDTVDRFISPCDFFTLDVADDIGQPAAPEEVSAFLARHPELIGTVSIDGIEAPFEMSRGQVEQTVRHFLRAVRQAGAIYRRVLERKGAGFVTEVSMDETVRAQTPPELLVILAALADEQVPVQTLAPKFSGRFNKGVDYIGDPACFEREFNDDLAVVAHAVKAYGLPPGLKLSVHSGSDKFSLYPTIRRALARSGAGLHLKTAGTTWLEELTGLATAGGAGLQLAKRIYTDALEQKEALCEPYATVIDIDFERLPSPAAVAAWSSGQFTAALRHDPSCADFNPHFRQLLHVGYKMAAGLGDTYLEALETHRASIAPCVTENILERHIKPLFYTAP